jgi:kynurenine formamidase
MQKLLTLRRIAVLAGAALAAAVFAQQAAWFPSRWGAADEIGAANHLSPALVQQAARLVRTGKVYSLGITVSPDTPAYPPRGCKLLVVQPGQIHGQVLGPTRTTYNDDILECWIGIGTQLDGLGHVGIDGVYYNGNKGQDFARMTGLVKLSTDKVPPIVTRGVVLDMAGLMNTPVVAEGVAFNRAEIDAAMRRQGVEIRQGDVVIFHTGWLSLIATDSARYARGEPGVGLEGARYLLSKGVVAVGADTWGVEAVPFPEGTGVFEVHQELLTKNGTYLLENVSTAELVRDSAWEFLFVLGQPKYKGAVQAMINPIAIR